MVTAVKKNKRTTSAKPKKAKAPKPQPVSQDTLELQNQVVWLKGKIGDSLMDLTEAQQNLRDIETQLSSFLEQYYQQVGGVFEQIFALERQVTGNAYVAEDDVEMDQSDSFAVAGKEAFSKDQIKRIYRKLARLLHPDSHAAHPQAQAYFPALHASYKEENMGLLLRIQHLLEEQQEDPNRNIIEELEHLEKRHDDVQASLDDTKLKIHALQHSKAYQFMRRVEWEKMCGMDVIARIKTQAEKRLHILQQMLEVTVVPSEAMDAGMVEQPADAKLA